MDEWTITSESFDVSDTIFVIQTDCGVYDTSSIGYHNGYSVVPAARPVMYLKQGTKIDFTHAGTSTDPYRIF